MAVEAAVAYMHCSASLDANWRIIMRALLAALTALFAVSSLPAGEATALFEDPQGGVRITVTIADPAGEIGILHFEAMRFTIRPAGGAQQRRLALAPESRAALAASPRAEVRGLLDPGGRFLLDWSNVRAEIRVESVAQCIAGIYGTVEGTIERGKSGYVVVQNTMSHVSVLTSMRGDADLYVYDGAGALVCASEMTRADRIPDQCAYLASDCGTASIPESVVEIRGLRKRNDFQLTIWAVDAI